MAVCHDVARCHGLATGLDRRTAPDPWDADLPTDGTTHAVSLSMTINANEVRVLSAMAYGVPAHEVDCMPHMIPASEVTVRVAARASGPIGPSDPPWGPVAVFDVSLSEISGRVAYPLGSVDYVVRAS